MHPVVELGRGHDRAEHLEPSGPHIERPTRPHRVDNDHQDIAPGQETGAGRQNSQSRAAEWSRERIEDQRYRKGNDTRQHEERRICVSGPGHSTNSGGDQMKSKVVTRVLVGSQVGV